MGKTISMNEVRLNHLVERVERDESLGGERKQAFKGLLNHYFSENAESLNNEDYLSAELGKIQREITRGLKNVDRARLTSGGFPWVEDFLKSGNGSDEERLLKERLTGFFNRHYPLAKKVRASETGWEKIREALERRNQHIDAFVKWLNSR